MMQSENDILSNTIDQLFKQYRQKIPVSPMSMEQRAAQFLPFAALTGFEESIQLASENQETIRIKADDENELFDYSFLVDLTKAIATKQQLELVYFEPQPNIIDLGIYVKKKVCVKKIDLLHKQCLIDDGKWIPFSNVFQYKIIEK